MKEFDDTTNMVKINKNNSVSTEEDRNVKNLVTLDYDVRSRISGTLDLKISVMKFLEFKVLGVSALKSWIKIFRKERTRLHSFPFINFSNEVVLKLKTKY